MQYCCININDVLNENQIERKEILNRLRTEGFRLTRARQSIINILSTGNVPLSLTDVKKNLVKKGVKADRTTIYREVLFLKGKKMLCEILVGGGRKGYKVCRDVHHHHLICVCCNKVEEMVFRKTLLSQENEISQRKDFKVLDHLLEFYGLCGDCQ
jgi:Fur family ferric uptake transcriptional regulator